PMKVVAGPFLDEKKWRSLRAESRGRRGLTLRRSVPDLGVALHSASASVSQCGYNTALDILRAGVPALVVPFAEGEEDEQEQRAHHLQRLGAVRVLDSEALDPSTLAEEIGTLLRFRPRRVSLDLQGGAKSARILAEMNERRSGRLGLQGRR
ncbi:MAG: glycosyltransferase, partial [Actinomycetota bacterium]